MLSKKEYVYGYVSGKKDLSDLNFPEIPGGNVGSDSVNNFILSLKEFLVNMKTIGLKEKMLKKEEVLKFIIGQLDEKKFKPGKLSHYDKFLVDIFKILNKSKAMTKQVEDLERAKEYIGSKCHTKDNVRDKKLKELASDNGPLAEFLGEAEKVDVELSEPVYEDE